MPPNSADVDETLMAKIIEDKPSKAAQRKHVINYPAVFTMTYFHLAALCGLYLSCTTAKWPTLVFAFILMVAAEIGITAGVHRLWSHRSFKAKMPLQIILMVLNTLAFQGTAIHWVRDHRLHHKYSDTDGDPHNASRGLFYSHIGWLLTEKSKDLIERGKNIDMSDIYSNPVLRFQEKYLTPFAQIVCFILPTIIPVFFWAESLAIAWHVNILRYVTNLNIGLLVNSFNHKIGYKPYDKNIPPTNNLFVTVVALGEGFHNFHHAFPWDYQTAELGNRYFNVTTLFIDFFAWIGWAYDLKVVPKDIVEIRKKREGDGTDLWGRSEKEPRK